MSMVLGTIISQFLKRHMVDLHKDTVSFYRIEMPENKYIQSFYMCI